MNKGKNKHSGFTLAEVLATLAVIGIVASMTIPSLMATYQEKTYKTRFKKIFSELSRAHTSIKTDNGGSVVGVFLNNDIMRDTYLDYIPAVKTRNKDDAVIDCFSPDSYYHLDGSDTVGISAFYSRAQLASGASLAFFRMAHLCNGTAGDLSQQVCGFIIIDVNGPKAPNTYGKDTFIVRSVKDRIVPDGSYGINEGDCHSSGAGRGCATKVLKNEDY